MALDGTCEPHSVGPSAQTSKKAGFNHAGGGTPAHCLRFAHPAEAIRMLTLTFGMTCRSRAQHGEKCPMHPRSLRERPFPYCDVLERAEYE